MEQKLIPAPLDEKNVTTDWIEDIFDDYQYAECSSRNAAVGFINKCPVYVNWHDNAIFWRVIENNINNYDETLEIIKIRLKEFEDPQSGLVSNIQSWGSNCIVQKFYFVDE